MVSVTHAIGSPGRRRLTPHRRRLLTPRPRLRNTMPDSKPDQVQPPPPPRCVLDLPLAGHVDAAGRVLLDPQFVGLLEEKPTAQSGQRMGKTPANP